MLIRSFITIAVLWPFFVFGQAHIDYHLQTTGQHRVHIFKFDPKQFEIKIIQASAEHQNKQSLYNLAKQHQPALAVNGGFFALNQINEARAVGALQVAGQWVSFNQIARGAIGWNDSHTMIDRLSVVRRQGKVVPRPVFHSRRDWQRMNNVLGGIPLLIANGQIIKNYGIESIHSKEFITKPHARTAVGLTSSGHWIIVVVEQRYRINYSAHLAELIDNYIQQKNHTARSTLKQKMTVSIHGLSLKALAQLMLDQGCRWAVNLDGGASTAAYFQGRLITQVFDGILPKPVLEQREIHNALMVFPRKDP